MFMERKTIGVVGCGNMGSAIVKGIDSGAYAKTFRVIVNDNIEEKSAALSDQTGATVAELKDLVNMADVMLISIKPQDSQSFFRYIKERIKADTIVISVMAGVQISAIHKSLGKDIPIVRAMPNMPGIIGEGITCFSCNSLVNDPGLVNNIFCGIGKVIKVDEGDMDSITAISGSGPAYFFYLVNALVKAAISNGIPNDVAAALVLQTFYGSAKLLVRGSLSAEDLIERIASKGGTTEAALNVFSEKKMAQIISMAVDKARQRSNQLSQG